MNNVRLSRITDRKLLLRIKLCDTLLYMPCFDKGLVLDVVLYN